MGKWNFVQLKKWKHHLDLLPWVSGGVREKVASRERNVVSHTSKYRAAQSGLIVAIMTFTPQRLYPIIGLECACFILDTPPPRNYFSFNDE